MTMIKKSKQITLAMTGASGAPYGLALLKKLVEAQYQVFVLVSSAARVVLATEHDLKLPSGPDAMQSKLVEHLGCGEDSIVVCGKETGSRQWLLALLRLSKWWCVRVQQAHLHLSLTVCQTT